MLRSTYLELVIIISIGGFFLGSVLFAKLFPRVLCGIDIEAVSEDGNPGTSNVFKYCGMRVGILTGICEFGKAFIPIEVANVLIPMEMRTPLFGLIVGSAVVGHIFSVYHHGNGGMGVAPFWGSLMGVFLQCQLIFVLLAIYIVVRYVFRVHEHHRRTIICFGIFLVMVALFATNMIYKPVYIILSAIVCAKCLYNAFQQRRAEAAQV